jgi:hypothetical protein
MRIFVGELESEVDRARPIKEKREMHAIATRPAHRILLENHFMSLLPSRNTARMTIVGTRDSRCDWRHLQKEGFLESSHFVPL